MTASGKCLAQLRARLPGLARAAAMVALAISTGWACKARDGDVCRCASDCREGLICVVEETEVLDLPAAGTPVVDIVRTAFTDAGRPVEVNEMILDASAYILRYDFSA